ncbi:DUF3077 domain-containing protein [Pseudomonas brenneri]|jgi:hypothetical protein|uniref:DUF6124 family protein n=1 Tax=Pseudomonas fluorescens group TaxID=136843 RepID=UPI0004155787|nr:MULTISPECIES: DUF3077 domain-containing protein [Pseudomonas fluorescens group]MBF8007078.1 DUF3077 domain-containing protein [Pseudomonas brenneri]WJM93601.1 DUF3077 domain-containing protein [Pseudomonas brenneri]
MNTTPDHLPGTPDDEIKLLQDSAAAQRALDYYLKEDPGLAADDVTWFEANPAVSSEEALIHASDLLRSAAAIAYELADNKLGGTRDLAFSVVYLIDMAKAMLERPLQLAGGKTP